MKKREGLGLLLMTAVFLLVVGAIGVYMLVQYGLLNGNPSDSPVQYGPFRAADGGGTSDLGAIEAYTRQINDNPDQPGPYLARAKVYLAMGEQGRAIRDFTSALDLGAEGAQIFSDRAGCYTVVGENGRAIEDYSRAIELRPDDPLLLWSRGDLRQRTGDAERAVEDLVRAADLYPTHRQIRRALAWSQWMTGDVDAALQSFDRAIELGMNGVHAYMARGAARYHRRELEAARADLERAIRAFDSDPAYAHLYLWLTQVRLGEPEAADETLRNFFNRADRMTLGEWTPRIALFLLGDITEEEFLAEAEAGNWQPAPEQMCEAYFYAGSVRLIDGDVETARAYFQRSVDTDVNQFYEYCSSRTELNRLNHDD